MIRAMWKGTAVAAIGLAAGAVLAGGVTIPVDSAIGPVPDLPGSGLMAAVWHSGVNTMAGADAVISGGPADAGFRATLIDYPNGGTDVVLGSETVTDLIGADAGGYFGTNSDHLGEIFRFTGFIAIDLAGPYTFAVGSDDGFRLRIGGVTVTEFAGDRGYSFSIGEAEFLEDGLYPIELVYYSNLSGQSGVEFYSSIAGGPNSGAPGEGNLSGIVPPVVLYPVPEPSTAALLALGVLALRRR